MTRREIEEILEEKNLPHIERIIFDKIIGMTDDQAAYYCRLRDYQYRSTPIGRALIGGADMVLERINAKTKKGIVVSYNIG